MRRVFAALLAVGAVGAVAAAVVVLRPTSGENGFSPRPIAWSDCTVAQCGTLEVPIDHARPEAGTIRLDVVRRPAEEAGVRLGTLLYVPGGPGGPGVPVVRDGNLFSQGLRNHFDIVSWDPRGVSRSTQFRCVDDRDSVLDERTPVQQRRWWKRFVAGCRARGGRLLSHLSTVDSARDIDLLRRALGEEQLTVLGQSYGTAVGSVYATLYPDRVRAAVFDGAYDLSGSYDRLAVQAARAEGAALTRMLRWCARYETCAFHSGGTPAAALARLLTRLRTHPLRSDGHVVGVGSVLAATHAALYSPDGWEPLVNALADARAGDGSALRGLAHTFRSDYDSGSATVCEDRASYTLSAATVAAVQRAIPLAFRLRASDIVPTPPCSDWPTAATPPPRVTADGAGPALVVGSTGDIATPLAASRDLADRLDRATLLVFEHDGHTAYRGSYDPSRDCVRGAVDRFLVAMRAPTDGAVCTETQTRPVPAR